MQPARLGQRPTLVNTQGPIRLRHAWCVTVVGQRAAAASQPAVASTLSLLGDVKLGTCMPTACGRSDRPEVTAPQFWKNVIIFVTTTSIDTRKLCYRKDDRAMRAI